MRTLNRNKQTFYYALYTSKTDYLVDGKKTGEFTKTYATPVAMQANISPAKGTAEIDQFGINDNYDRTICTDNVTCPIQEDTILWIDREPFDEEGNPVPHNYKVYRVAKSFNDILIAIKKVSVS